MASNDPLIPLTKGQALRQQGADFASWLPAQLVGPEEKPRAMARPQVKPGPRLETYAEELRRRATEQGQELRKLVAKPEQELDQERER